MSDDAATTGRMSVASDGVCSMLDVQREAEGETMSTMTHEVVQLDAQEAQSAVAATLARAGFTFDELREQARADDFVNVGAHLAWLVVQRLGNPAIA